MLTLLVAFTLLWNMFAPLPPQIAINPDTKECGNFWAGDEYTEYRLSPPWKIINYGSPVQIGTGVYTWNGGISASSVESFCNQIAYTYLSGNLGQTRGQHGWTAYAFTLFAAWFIPLMIVLVIVFIALVFLLRWLYKRRKTAPVS